MATEFPNSYRDPLYASLDAKTEEKLGLPSGLLSSIRLNGERSNNDQSPTETGAKSPYQFIPATRQAIIKKYGIDPLLSPENASEAAGLLLKEGMERNKGNPALAVAEYIGGTDRSNWGPTTKAYVARVTGGVPSAPKTSNQSIIARAYDAYRAGRMSPEDAAEFEADVNAGTIELPLGASVKRRAEPSADSFKVPQSVVDAYKAGKMAPEDAAEFERDMRANPALVPEGMEIKAFKASIPGAEASDARPPAAAPTIGERIVGAGETALNLGTGLVGGAVAPVAGLATALTSPNAADGSLQGASNAAGRVAENLTYAPRTSAGQDMAAATGNALSNAIPLAGLTGEMGALARAGQVARPTTQAIAPIVRDTVGTAAQNVAQGVRAAPARVMGAVGLGEVPAAPTPGTMGSVGAMGVDMATQRRMAAQELPVPIELTKGQATRDFAAQRFEGETAKNPEAGAPIRERFTEQNKQVVQNLDAYLDMTGAEAPDLRSVGIKVDTALRQQLAKDKAEVRVAYKNAEKAGELEAPVSTQGVIDLLNESSAAEGTAKVLGAAKKEIQRLGGATLDDAGNLLPAEMPLKNMEQLRQFINSNMEQVGPDAFYGPRIKSAIDAATEGAGGTLYREARAKRARVAQNYEDRAVINRLLSEKPGTSDRRVAFEDVFKHSVLDGSLDDVRNVRRVLHRSGDEGRQAWKELQGQTVSYLREEATKNVARDQAGNPIVSASGLDRAVKRLDADGKLKLVFGEKGAEQIRTLNDVTNHIKTVAPGAVNTSNTASVILAAMDMAISGAGGMPLPIMSGLRLAVNNVKDRRLRMRVSEALGDAMRKERAQPKPIEGVTKKRTVH